MVNLHNLELTVLLAEHQREHHKLELSPRQRLALLLGSPDVRFEEALAADVGTIDGAFLLRSCCKAANLIVADLSGDDMAKMGITVELLRKMGVDCLDLIANEPFARAVCAAFGGEAVRLGFLVSSHDSVTLACGAPELRALLGVDANALLRACAGSPGHASCVLRALQLQACELDPGAVLASGLDGAGLAQAGVGLASLLEAKYDGEVLVRLGFKGL